MQIFFRSNITLTANHTTLIVHVGIFFSCPGNYVPPLTSTRAEIRSWTEPGPAHPGVEADSILNFGLLNLHWTVTHTFTG